MCRLSEFREYARDFHTSNSKNLTDMVQRYTAGDVESIIDLAASSKERMGKDFWCVLGELQFYYNEV